ncbi:MAG: ABC-2 family transporter protein [Lachnospiraceae bacterium]|nr:ABC-2 family transporter protein [Lachnospiraceae bacterium]
MNKFLTLIKSGILVTLRFRLGVFVTIIGNLIYLIIVYFLWRSIYLSSGNNVLNGMTFEDTMIYLVLASSMFTLLESYLTWRMHEDIQSGKIILDLIKPMGYQLYKSLGLIGEMLFKLVTTLLPTFIVVYFLSNFHIQLGINLIFFFLSMIIGIVISLCIDFLVGTICLYTQSIWGVNMIKEVLVLLLSGAVIPLNFFPQPLKNITMYLPFQAIYNAPLQQLLNTELSIYTRFSSMGIQLIWLVALLLICKVFWWKSLRIITVNGG